MQPTCMQPTCSVTVALMLAGLAPLAGAQMVPAPAVHRDYTLSFDAQVRRLGAEHLGSLDGAYGRIVSTNFNPDRRADAVMMVGDRPVFLYGPGLYHSLIDMPLPCNDVAPVPGSPSEGGVAMVSDRGLEIWRYDPITAQFTVDSLTTAPWWQNATRLTCADVDSSGTPEFIAIGADQHTVLVHATPGEIVVPLPFTVLDVVPIDWYGDGTCELAVLTTGGVTVRTLSGLVVQGFPGAPSVTGIAVITEKSFSGTLHRLVMFSASNGHLRVADRFGMTGVMPVDASDAYAATVADLDLDGRDDLVLARDQGDLVVLQNRGHAATFALIPGAYTLIDPSPEKSGTGCTAIPAVRDLDNDGDPDLLYADKDTQTVAVIRNALIDHRALAPKVVDASYDYSADDAAGVLSLTVDAKPLPTLSPLRLEVVVWRQDAAPAPVGSVAIAHELLPVSSAGQAWVQVPIEEDLLSPALHSVEIRTVSVAVGQPKLVSPTEVYTCGTLKSATAEIATLHGVSPAEIIPVPLNGDPISLADVGVGLVPLGCVPCFTNDEFPDPLPKG